VIAVVEGHIDICITLITKFPEGGTGISIRDKKNIPNTVSVLGILFHKNNSYGIRDIISIIQNGIRDIIPGMFY
jgi:hypothetical protein